MRHHRQFVLALAIATASVPGWAQAHSSMENMLRADSHGPIGVMGDHLMMAGKWMLTYRYMQMSMSGNLIGTTRVSPAAIVSTIPNLFSGRPGQPPTLRVVPTGMTTQKHVLSLMYAPTRILTLVVMTSYIEKSMAITVFRGPSGTDRLGTFSMHSTGLGDTQLTALLGVLHRGLNRAHLILRLSLPTGSITQHGVVLTPKNTLHMTRLPYPMQLGSGTYDISPGATYKGRNGAFGWGAQYLATVRTGRNQAGYRLGNRQQLSIWGSYGWARWLSTSLRVAAVNTSRIHGIDPAIVLPTQTANPRFSGGKQVDVGVGLNMAKQQGPDRAIRFGVEVVAPVYQDLNGPQLSANWKVIAGLQDTI